MIILSSKIYNNFRREALELRTSEIFGMTSELFEKIFRYDWFLKEIC